MIKENVHDGGVNVMLLLFLWNHSTQTKRGLLENVFVLSTNVGKLCSLYLITLLLLLQKIEFHFFLLKGA